MKKLEYKNTPSKKYTSKNSTYNNLMIIGYVKLNREKQIIDIHKKAGRRLGMKLLDN